MPIELALSSGKKVFFSGSVVEERYTEGSSTIVTVTNELGTEIFKKSFTQFEKAQKFRDKYLFSFPGHSPALGLLVPPRTDSLKRLAKNVFFPTFSAVINHDFYSEGWFAKTILAPSLGLGLDLLTLPERLVMTPIKMFYNRNAVEAEHPLYKKLLKKDPAAALSLKNEPLTVRIERQVVKIEMEPSQSEDLSERQAFTGDKGQRFTADIRVETESFPLVGSDSVRRPAWKETKRAGCTHIWKGLVANKEGEAYIHSARDRTYSNQASQLQLFGASVGQASPLQRDLEDSDSL